MYVTRLALVCATTALVACGGSSTGNGAASSSAADLDAAQRDALAEAERLLQEQLAEADVETDGVAALRERFTQVGALDDSIPTFGTVEDAMPTGGSARFVGSAGIFIFGDQRTDADDILLLGDAALTARFSNGGAVTGLVDNFTGSQGASLDQATVGTATGEITIGGSSAIGGSTLSANSFVTDFDGDIDGFFGAYSIEGAVVGQFFGTRVSNPNTDIPMKGLRAVAQSGFATDRSSGQTSDFIFEIIAANPID